MNRYLDPDRLNRLREHAAQMYADAARSQAARLKAAQRAGAR